MGVWAPQQLLYKGATLLWGTFFKFQVEVTTSEFFWKQQGPHQGISLMALGEQPREQLHWQLKFLYPQP